MTIKYMYAAVFAVVISCLMACKKDNQETGIKEKGTFTLEFENTVSGKPLVLNSQNYINAHGDSYTISTFKYYVSNVKLSKADGSSFNIPESYILVDASKPSSSFVKMVDIPAGDYTGIAYTIGVDKERNLAGAQTGALDPALGMFWTWNSGYIFVKLEGKSPQSTAADNSLTFHIGGIVEPNNTIRTFSTAFSSANPLRIRHDKIPQIHFKVDAGSLFNGKQNISFANLNFTMGGAKSVIIADNYAGNLFQLDHIHN